MDISVFEKLHAEGIIGNNSLQQIKNQSVNKNISVHWELKTILYLGVLLLAGGLGIAIYKNIDSIGHQAILAAIAVISASCFFYCTKNKKPFSTQKTDAPNIFFDYLLLLACLTFASFVAYLQFQYNVFGNRYGLASFFPMLVFFFCAYYFDHLGLLSLGITNLAAWAGIAITPTSILRENDFNSTSIIITGLLLGVALVAVGIATKLKKIKPHFEFTYTNFGTHLLFIACLAALFNFNNWYLIWLLVLAGICVFYYSKAINEKSFYYILLLTLYGYIGLSYSFVRLLLFFENGLGGGSIYLTLLYFIFSSFGMVMFLISMNKKLKSA